LIQDPSIIAKFLSTEKTSISQDLAMG